MSKIYISENSDYDHITINDLYKLFIVQNVKDYSFINFNTHEIEQSTSLESELPKCSYLIIDLIYHEAFAHWVFESAIYLQIFSTLKGQFPNLKLVLKIKKQFKTLFIKYFNIEESDVIDDSEMDPHNTCFFPSPISSFNYISGLPENYKQIITCFREIFKPKNETVDHKYDYVILPRQKKVNKPFDNRMYYLDPLYEQMQKDGKSYYVLNTDDIKDLKDQIERISWAKNIIVTDGSPFLVNSLFCKDQNIYIIDNITYGQAQGHPRMRFIIDSILTSNQNNNMYNSFSDLVSVEHQ